jgi:hypothetical protein
MPQNFFFFFSFSFVLSRFTAVRRPHFFHPARMASPPRARSAGGDEDKTAGPSARQPRAPIVFAAPPASDADATLDARLAARRAAEQPRPAPRRSRSRSRSPPSRRRVEVVRRRRAGSSSEEDGDHRPRPARSAAGWTLFATGFAPATSEESILDAFQASGGGARLTDSSFPLSRSLPHPSAAFIKFSERAHAAAALRALDGSVLGKGRLAVSWAFVEGGGGGGGGRRGGGGGGGRRDRRR